MRPELETELGEGGFELEESALFDEGPEELDGGEELAALRQSAVGAVAVQRSFQTQASDSETSDHSDGIHLESDCSSSGGQPGRGL